MFPTSGISKKGDLVTKEENGKIMFEDFKNIKIETEGKHDQHISITTTNLTQYELKLLKELLINFKYKVIKYYDISRYNNNKFEIAHTKIEDVINFINKTKQKTIE